MDQIEACDHAKEEITRMPQVGIEPKHSKIQWMKNIQQSYSYEVILDVSKNQSMPWHTESDSSGHDIAYFQAQGSRL